MTQDLYAKDLLRWAADVTHVGRLSTAHASATEANPMCGDKCHVDFSMDGANVLECRHETRACVLTQGSAAILAAHVTGETSESMVALRDAISAMLKSEAVAPDGKWSAYRIFTAAAPHKSRHTCVLLPLEAAVKALSGRN